MYPTTLSRFSNNNPGDLHPVEFCPLSISQGSQIYNCVNVDHTKFCTLPINQGSQTCRWIWGRSLSVLSPTPFSRFSNVSANTASTWSVLYPTPFSRFSNLCRRLCKRLLVLYPTVFQGSQIGIRTIFSVNSFVLYSILKVLKLTRSKSVLYYVLFPTAFSRFSNCTFTPEYFLSSFAPYSILKDLKLSIQELGSSFVLYPTALSRFSNGFYYSLSYGLFCTLRHFQGSQARRWKRELQLRFCASRHSQGSQVQPTPYL